MTYKRRTMGGGGATFRERKKTRVSCTMCGVAVVSSYLKARIARSHGIWVPHTRGVYEVGGGTSTYVVSFPRVVQ